MKEKKIWQDSLLLRSVCRRPQQGMFVPLGTEFWGAVQSWGEGLFAELASGYFCLN